MTQEDKDLLLVDLCVRLPYGVKVLYGTQIFEVQYIEPMHEELKLLDNERYTLSIEEVKPYLFPLSSIKTTFEGVLETSDSKSRYSLPDFWRFSPNCIGIKDNEDPYINICDMNEFFDWCNQNHIDYRNWIEKGIAIDATNLNIY